MLYLAAKSLDEMDKWMKEFKSGIKLYSSQFTCISFRMHFDKERGYFRILMLPTLLKPEQLLKEQESQVPRFMGLHNKHLPWGESNGLI